MKKKILALTLCVAMLAIMLVSGTLAYFTDTKDATNTFAVGNVEINLTESEWVDTENTYPGQKLDKNPTVENVGHNPCFVRVMVTGLDQFVEEFGEEAFIKFLTDGEEDTLGDNWAFYNGYAYYTEVLEVGETTDALFDQIMLPFGLTNSADTIPVVVTAEAAQAQGIEIEGEEPTLEEIAAWMDICLGTVEEQA